MFYVYLLESLQDSTRHYVGFSEDLRQRLKDHNAGFSKHTSKFKPWRVKTYLAFDEKDKALNFERYLKTSSGIAFRRKRF